MEVHTLIDFFFIKICEIAIFDINWSYLFIILSPSIDTNNGKTKIFIYIFLNLLCIFHNLLNY